MKSEITIVSCHPVTLWFSWCEIIKIARCCVSSESSMFVTDRRIVLKTCGRSRLLKALDSIVRLAESCGLGIVQVCYRPDDAHIIEFFLVVGVLCSNVAYRSKRRSISVTQPCVACRTCSSHARTFSNPTTSPRPTAHSKRRSVPFCRITFVE